VSAAAINERSLANLKPWRPGQSGNPGGMSKERRELYEAIEKNHVPRVLDVLLALFNLAIEGDVAAARLWLDQVRGPVKARSEDELERAVETKLLEMAAAVRAAKVAGVGGG
jgi:Family of unknown function (DUF5681)